MAKSDVAKIYETLLSTPGMNDTVKISFQTSRKNILLLQKIIERSTGNKETDERASGFFDSANKEMLEAVSQIGQEVLNKAGLTELNEKLKLL